MSKTITPYTRSSKLQEQRSDVMGLHWYGIQEINSGAIGPSTVRTYSLDVQSNTAKGLWDFHSFEKSQADEDEPCEFLESLERRHRPSRLFWGMRSPSIVTRPPVARTSAATDVISFITIDDHVAEDGESLDDWRSSPSELLTRLLDESTSRNELFDVVLFAEIAEFDEPQTAQLVTGLFAFVDKYRLSRDDDAKTAVGAAVRKLAMNLLDSQIEQYANLFLPTDTDTLPCEIELELAKAILWRLTASPASLSREFPELENRLTELASDYLKPRLILQENYASVALQAALGVILLNAQHADFVLESVRDLGIGWFTDLFQRRLGRLREQLVKTEEATSTTVATNLARLESELQRTSDQDNTTACQRGD